MDKKTEVFADGIGQIHFAGGMVRYDFVTLQPGAGDGALSAESTLRVIMPLRGFLSAYGSMQELIGKLVEAGVLKKNEPAAAAAEPEAKAPKASRAKKGKKK